MSSRRRLLERIGSAILQLDIGVSSVQLKRDSQRVLNQALTIVGSPRVSDMSDLGRLRRAAQALEQAVD